MLIRSISELFASCFEIKRTMDQLLSSPTNIQVRFCVARVSRDADFSSASAQGNCPHNTQGRRCCRPRLRRGARLCLEPISPSLSQLFSRPFKPLLICNLSSASCCSRRRPPPQPPAHVRWIASKFVALFTRNTWNLWPFAGRSNIDHNFSDGALRHGALQGGAHALSRELVLAVYAHGELAVLSQSCQNV